MVVAAGISDPKLHMYEAIWEVAGQFLPVNNVEAGMFMDMGRKGCEGKLMITPKAIAHAEGTNMVRLPRTSAQETALLGLCCRPGLLTTIDVPSCRRQR